MGLLNLGAAQQVRAWEGGAEVSGIGEVDYGVRNGDEEGQMDDLVWVSKVCCTSCDKRTSILVSTWSSLSVIYRHTH